jgi:hypothetical protein
MISIVFPPLIWGLRITLNAHGPPGQIDTWHGFASGQALICVLHDGPSNKKRIAGLSVLTTPEIVMNANKHIAITLREVICALVPHASIIHRHIDPNRK